MVLVAVGVAFYTTYAINKGKDFACFENVQQSSGSISLLDPDIRVDSITVNGEAATVNVMNNDATQAIQIVREDGYNYWTLDLQRFKTLEGHLTFTTASGGVIQYVLTRKVSQCEMLMIDGKNVKFYTRSAAAKINYPANADADRSKSPVAGVIFAASTGIISLKPLDLPYNIMVHSEDVLGNVISLVPRTDK